MFNIYGILAQQIGSRSVDHGLDQLIGDAQSHSCSDGKAILSGRRVSTTTQDSIAPLPNAYDILKNVFGPPLAERTCSPTEASRPTEAASQLMNGVVEALRAGADPGECISLIVSASNTPGYSMPSLYKAVEEICRGTRGTLPVEQHDLHSNAAALVYALEPRAKNPIQLPLEAFLNASGPDKQGRLRLTPASGEARYRIEDAAETQSDSPVEKAWDLATFQVLRNALLQQSDIATMLHTQFRDELLQPSLSARTVDRPLAERLREANELLKSAGSESMLQALDMNVASEDDFELIFEEQCQEPSTVVDGFEWVSFPDDDRHEQPIDKLLNAMGLKPGVPVTHNHVQTLVGLGQNIGQRKVAALRREALFDALQEKVQHGNQWQCYNLVDKFCGNDVSLTQEIAALARKRFPGLNLDTSPGVNSEDFVKALIRQLAPADSPAVLDVTVLVQCNGRQVAEGKQDARPFVVERATPFTPQGILDRLEEMIRQNASVKSCTELIDNYCGTNEKLMLKLLSTARERHGELHNTFRFLSTDLIAREN